MDGFPERNWHPLDPEIERRLRESEVVDGGRIPYASNYVFLLELRDDGADEPGYAIYKPARGENPLWDFPPDLYKREVAAYRLSRELGWNLIPPTIEREDGLEYGAGSLQTYIPTNYRCTFFELREEHPERLQQFALFDALANNADRKGGHILQAADGNLWGIDNALCFHEEEKLRTVIWDWASQPIIETHQADITRLLEDLNAEGDIQEALKPYLSESELIALAIRATELLQAGALPEPPPDRRSYPWPLI